TITQADEAQSSRVLVLLPDDPYVAAFEPSGTTTVSSHSPVSSDSTAPLSPDHPLTHVSPTPTPTRVSFHYRTARIAVRTQPTLSLCMLARIAEAAALSPSSFRKRYRSSYETSSSSKNLLEQKRYLGTSKLILDTDSEGDEFGDEDTEEDEEDKSLDTDDEKERSDEKGHGLGDEDHGLDNESQGVEDEGLGLEKDEAVLEGQQQAVLVVKTSVSEPLGIGYGALRRHELAVGEDQTPPSPEWSLGCLPVSPSSPVVPSPIASPVATLTATISVDEDQFMEVGAYDMRELYIRSRAVRDEIFSHRYMFRSLEREQDRAIVTFRALWRPVLALEAWAGQAAMQRELQEMRGRVTALEQERSRRGQ
ncbi:hypothetical protein Tco_1379615, partial [Tanacetum coccineum]